jgi:hypothetical protein
MSIYYLPAEYFTFMNWGLIISIALTEYVFEELDIMLTTMDVM